MYRSTLISGKTYGSSSRDIYEDFCVSLKWDIVKAKRFGSRSPLYADKADTDRSRGVWFINFPKYELIDTEGAKYTTFVLDNCKTIIEVVDETRGECSPNDRITFVKTQYGYKFLGVYALKENGLRHVFEKVSDVYPIEQ
jgi:hypothetical protein